MTDSLFNQDGGQGGGDGGANGGGGGDAPQVPDWINEKFRSAENPMEAQARAYGEAVQRLTTKTDELRGEVSKEIEAGIRAEYAPPAKVEDYKLPADWKADHPLAGAALAAFHEAGFTQKHIDAALGQFRAATSVDIEAEKAKLGADADARIAAVNKFLTAHVDKSAHGEVAKIMRSAASVQIFEGLMKVATGGSNLPRGGGDDGMTNVPTDEGLRALVADERYKKRDPAHMKEVTAYATRLGQHKAKAAG